MPNANLPRGSRGGRVRRSSALRPGALLDLGLASLPSSAVLSPVPLGPGLRARLLGYSQRGCLCGQQGWFGPRQELRNQKCAVGAPGLVVRGNRSLSGAGCARRLPGPSWQTAASRAPWSEVQYRSGRRQALREGPASLGDLRDPRCEAPRASEAVTS